MSRVFIAGLLAIPLIGVGSSQQETWIDRFDVPRAEFASAGRNPYFILEPGLVLTLQGGDEMLTITVLNETKVVDGVETRVVEERETKGGALVEVSRNYFAISKRTNDVYYFGEDVDIYEKGKITSHEGAWLAGVKGARFGLAMPGRPVVGSRYYQEIAPGVAMDRAHVVSLTDTLTVGLRRLTDVLRVEETTPLEPGVREFKRYARNIGLVEDGSLKLVAVGRRQ